MTLQKSDVWFITGCSTGFGRELAKLVLDQGYRAVITARDTSKIQDLKVGHDGRVLALKLDVTDRTAVEDAVRRAESAFGSIDVLVNNAGYGGNKFFWSRAHDSCGAAGHARTSARQYR